MAGDGLDICAKKGKGKRKKRLSSPDFFRAADSIAESPPGEALWGPAKPVTDRPCKEATTHGARPA